MMLDDNLYTISALFVHHFADSNDTSAQGDKDILDNQKDVSVEEESIGLAVHYNLTTEVNERFCTASYYVSGHIILTMPEQQFNVNELSDYKQAMVLPMYNVAIKINCSLCKWFKLETFTMYLCTSWLLNLIGFKSFKSENILYQSLFNTVSSSRNS